MNWVPLLTRDVSISLPVLLALVMAVPASAQTLGQPAEAAAEEPASNPNIFLLRDDDGNLIFVPDFSFDRYEELVQLERELLPPSPPGYTFLQKVTLQAEVVGTHAVLSTDCRIRINERPAGSPENPWTRIPLRFDQAIRTAEFQHDGVGEVLWHFEESSGGHILWIRASAGSEHRLTWRMKVPLTQVGDRTQLFLRVPATAAELSLALSGEEFEFALANPDRSFIAHQDSTQGTTRVVVEASGGELDLQWGRIDATPPLLEAVGVGRVRLMGRDVDTTMTLKVRSFSTPVESFLVRLPPGAELIPLPSPDVQVQLWEPVEGDSAQVLGPGSIVRVARQGGDTSDEIVVTLQTLRRATAAEAAGAPIETAGFEVIDAVRQSGVIDFEVDGEWTVDWIPGRYVRQSRGSAELLPPSTTSAQFVYSRQPYSLKVDIAARKSRVSVEPTYWLDVDAEELRLHARLKFVIRGPRARSLKVATRGWTVDRVMPIEAVESFEPDGEEVTIYLTADTTMPGTELELFLDAHQRYAEEFRVELPRPQVASAAPAMVAVVSADNVQLVPRVEGLTADTTPPSLSLPQRQQPPLLFREEGARGDGAVLSATVNVLERRISVAVHSEIMLAEQHVQVEQQMSYDIEYEPVRQLALQVPPAVFQSSEWSVTMDGIELATAMDLAAENSGELDLRFRPSLIVELGEDRIGPCQLVLRYRQAMQGDFPEGQSSLVKVELAQPDQDGVTGITENRLRLTSSDFFESKQVDRGWELISAQGMDEPFPQPPMSEPMYFAKGRIDSVTAEVVAARRQRESATTLQRVWLQSWLTGSVRRDRACFRLLTNQSQLQIHFPGTVTEVEVALDGVRRSSEHAADEPLRIELDGTAAARDHTLEIWYSTPVRPAAFRRISAALPHIVGTERADRLFWQIILPDREHLLWSSRNLTREFLWEWLGLHWGRRSNRDQRQLETLLRASHQDPIPKATNRYLFSAVGRLQLAQSLTASRTAVVVGLSAISMVAGLLLVYLPPKRYPALAVVFGVLLLGSSVIFTDMAILAAQCATLGLSLVLVARLWQWTITIRTSSPLGGEVAAAVRHASRTSALDAGSQPGSSQLPTAISRLPYSVSTTETEL